MPHEPTPSPEGSDPAGHGQDFGSELSEFVIDQRQQLLSGFRISVLRPFEESGKLARGVRTVASEMPGSCNIGLGNRRTTSRRRKRIKHIWKVPRATTLQ